LILLHFAPLGGWNLAKTLGTHQEIKKKYKNLNLQVPTLQWHREVCAKLL
jgi:hypothetical protein